MRKLLLLAGAAAALLTIAPEPADAQGMRRGVYRGGVYRGGPVVRSYGYRRPGYVYRRGYGWGPAAVGLGVLGAAAVGAAAAGAYGYADPCLRQQQVYDIYGNIVWQTVRVC
jgi:hypothetical protein